MMILWSEQELKNKKEVRSILFLKDLDSLEQMCYDRFMGEDYEDL